MINFIFFIYYLIAVKSNKGGFRKKASEDSYNDPDLYRKNIKKNGWEPYEDWSVEGNRRDDSQDLSEMAAFVKKELSKRNAPFKTNMAPAPSDSDIVDPNNSKIVGLSSLFRHQNLTRLINDVNVKIESLGEVWSDSWKSLLIGIEHGVFLESKVVSTYKLTMVKMINQIRKSCFSIEDLKKILKIKENNAEEKQKINGDVNESKPVITENNNNDLITEKESPNIINDFPSTPIINSLNNLHSTENTNKNLISEENNNDVYISSEMFQEKTSETPSLASSNDSTKSFIKPMNISYFWENKDCDKTSSSEKNLSAIKQNSSPNKFSNLLSNFHFAKDSILPGQNKSNFITANLISQSNPKRRSENNFDIATDLMNEYRESKDMDINNGNHPQKMCLKEKSKEKIDQLTVSMEKSKNKSQTIVLSQEKEHERSNVKFHPLKRQKENNKDIVVEKEEIPIKKQKIEIDSSDRSRKVIVSKIVVEVLTKFFRIGKFQDKDSFKVLAKSITDMLMSQPFESDVILLKTFVNDIVQKIINQSGKTVIQKSFTPDWDRVFE